MGFQDSSIVEPAIDRLNGPCALTVIVDAGGGHGDLLSTIEAIRDDVAQVDGQVIVSCDEPWKEAPGGVDVVVFSSSGRGDRSDAASRSARGELLAFVDSRVTFEAGWAAKVIQVFEDTSVVVAGGPVVPQGQRLSERIGALVMTRCLSGTPAAHNSRRVHPKTVREVGSSNMVVRASAFRSVGGFQAPGQGGEAIRLCYKVRTLLGGRIVSEPGLILSAPAPAFPRELLGSIAIYGRCRGDLARRFPEAAPRLPYALPSLVSILIFLNAALFLLGDRVLRACSLVIVGLIALFVGVHSMRTLRGPAPLGDRLLAGLALPVVLVVFGIAFLRGFVGRSMEDISPPRDRIPPLRVLILNWRDVTHPGSGGAETYMHEIARRWAADGMDVAWLTQHHAGSRRQEVIDRIHIYRVGGRMTLYLRAALTYLVRMRGRYDIVVDCENGIPFFSPFYCRVPKVLVVHHVHQEVFRRQVPRQLRWIALWLEGWLMPRMYRRTHVVAVSEGTRADLVDLGFDPRRISVVTNGVVPPTHVQKVPAKQPTILCMGRLKRQKSVDVLIESLPAILETVPDLHVDIVGQGPDRKRLERLAWSTGMAGHIRFHGYVNSKMRDDIAAGAWVAVCPSAFEGWGVVCMEASARGLPVIASNVAGLRESVRDGETGILVPYGDAMALAAAVVALVENAARRESMGLAGMEWAARHSWDDSASGFAALLSAQVPVRVVTSKVVAAVATWRY